jgi:hypothetical protein
LVTNQKISVAPTVQVLGLLQNMNYTPWYAIGEFVDNSITSFVNQIRDSPTDERFQRLKVEIKWDDALNRMVITDNAAGIPDTDDGWKRALELGATNPDPSVLGVYGYGMKAAAFWWAPKIEISSKVAGEQVSRSVSMDIEEIQNKNLEFIPLREVPDPDVEGHGTTVVLHGLNTGRSYPRAMTLGKVRSYLASMYRSYLRGDEGFCHPQSGERFLTISVQNFELVAPNPELLREPFWPRPTPPPESGDSIYWRKEISFEIPNQQSGESGAKPFLVKGWAGVLKTMSSDSGLFLMYHGKGLVGVGQGTGQAAQDTYKPPSIFGPVTGWRNRRLVAELDVSEFNKLNTSDGIKFSDFERETFEVELEKELHRTLVYEMANNYRPNSKGDYSERQLGQLQEVVNNTAANAEAVNRSVDLENLSNATPLTLQRLGVERVTADKMVYTNNGQAVRFTTVFGDEEMPWLSIWPAADNPAVIEVNVNHPFIQKYCTIPKNDPSGIFEVAIGIGLAELERPSLGELRAILNRRMDAHYTNTSIDETDVGVDFEL